MQNYISAEDRRKERAFKDSRVDYDYKLNLSGFSNIIQLCGQSLKVIITCYMSDHINRVMDLLKGISNNVYKIASIDASRNNRIWLLDENDNKFWIEVDNDPKLNESCYIPVPEVVELLTKN